MIKIDHLIRLSIIGLIAFSTGNLGPYSAKATVTTSTLVGGTTPTNQPPTVNAGPDQNIAVNTTAQLSGTASDDGLPTGSVLAVHWSGPQNVVFGTPNTLATTATFPTTGSYTLMLTASDGAQSSSDSVVVSVV